MSEIFYIKKGDTLPVLDIYLFNPDGTAYDLTGYTTIKLFLKHTTSMTLEVNGAAMTVVGGAAEGHVQYAWQASDTDTAGTYNGEVQVTKPGGKQTFPTTDYFSVTIVDDLGD